MAAIHKGDPGIDYLRVRADGRFDLCGMTHGRDGA